MVEIPEHKLREIEDKIRDLINQIEILVVDEKIDEEAAEELTSGLKELANMLGTA